MATSMLEIAQRMEQTRATFELWGAVMLCAMPIIAAIYAGTPKGLARFKKLNEEGAGPFIGFGLLIWLMATMFNFKYWETILPFGASALPVFLLTWVFTRHKVGQDKKRTSFFDKFYRREDGPHYKPVNRIIEGDKAEAERTMIENEGLEAVEEDYTLCGLVKLLKTMEPGKGLNKAVLIDCKKVMSMRKEDLDMFILILREGRKFGLFACIYGASEDLYTLMHMDSTRYGMIAAQVWPFDERAKNPHK